MIFKLHLQIVYFLSGPVLAMTPVLARAMASDHKVGYRDPEDEVQKRMAHKVLNCLLTN